MRKRHSPVQYVVSCAPHYWCESVIELVLDRGGSMVVTHVAGTLSGWCREGVYRSSDGLDVETRGRGADDARAEAGLSSGA